MWVNCMQNSDRKYYEAYEERYKAAHEKGVSWEHMKSTPIVLDILLTDMAKREILKDDGERKSRRYYLR